MLMLLSFKGSGRSRVGLPRPGSAFEIDFAAIAQYLQRFQPPAHHQLGEAPLCPTQMTGQSTKNCPQVGRISPSKWLMTIVNIMDLRGILSEAESMHLDSKKAR
jgi:hypothetical protein